MAKRFASHTDDKILQQRLKSILTTTERANKRAANLLQQYLAATSDDTQFELFSSERLMMF
jgi:DNA polymerase III delta prime subunit